MVGSRTRELWSGVRAAVTVLVAATALTWSHPPGPEPLRLSLGTGGVGGVYHAYGAGLAGAVSSSQEDAELVAHATAASVQNNRLVASGALDAAFTLADVAALAVAGEGPFESSLPVNAIARLYDNHTHVVVRADSSYEELEDLAGGTVSVGARGSGTEMMAERLLELADLNDVPEDPVVSEEEGASGVVRLRLSIGASAQALESGQVDALFWSGGLPTEAVADLADRTPIRLLDLADHVPDLVREYGEYFSERPVPAGTYAGVPAVRTIGVPSLLVVNSDMSRHKAERLTRLLFESRSELAEIHPVALHLNPRSAIATLPVPLHPGAAAYYRSTKYAHDDA